MYKARLSEWDVGKNVSKQDWCWVALLLRERNEAGKKVSVVEIRKRIRTSKDCLKFIMKYDTAELETLATDARSGEQTVPPYIRCFTPDSSTSEASDRSLEVPQGLSNSSSTKIGSANVTVSPGSSGRSRSHGKSSSFDILGTDTATMQLPSQPNGAPAIYRPNVSSETVETGSSLQDIHIASQGDACDRVQQEVRVMVEQTASPGRLALFAEGLGDQRAWSLLSHCPCSGFLKETCTKCGTEISQHDPLPQDFLSAEAGELPNNYEPLLGAESGYYHAFTAACMGACMYGAREDFDIMHKCMGRAEGLYKEMLVKEDALALMSVNMALIWLHAHDQGSLAGSVVRLAYRVAVEVLGATHDISITLEWMTEVAFRRHKTCKVKTSDLKNVVRRFQESYGPRHQHTIIAIYNLGFSFILDKKFEEAEQHLQHLVPIASQTLGPQSLQTVSALNTLSRAQAGQGNYGMAIMTLKEGLKHAPLGANHPFRLASIKRLAYLLKKIGRIAEEEPLRRQVLEGRIATLGPEHVNTQKAREELLDLLQELGRGEVMEREVESIFERARTLPPPMAKYEDQWRCVVVEGGKY